MAGAIETICPKAGKRTIVISHPFRKECEMDGAQVIRFKTRPDHSPNYGTAMQESPNTPEIKC